MIYTHWMMQSLHRLHPDATIPVPVTVGQTASVYSSIPGRHSGAGKVTVTVQGRLVELPAMTPDEELPSGARVVVTGMRDGQTLEVAAAG
jgi:hypothetical protein